MLSLFPSFFDYSAVATAILRVVVAIIFITNGYKSLPKNGMGTTFYRSLLSILEITLGVFFSVGLFTQAVAVVFSLASLKNIHAEYKNKFTKELSLSFYVLLFFISLFFLFSGPGLWSIDYPL